MKFSSLGPMALLPSAISQDFSTVEILPPKHGPTATVIAVRGPLSHHSELVAPEKPWSQPSCFDSYDAIRGRAEIALRGDTKTVILSIDSPGGGAIGIFALVIELRAMAKAAGKQLITWVDGTCASAAYALACAGEKIYAAPGTIIGSIGVIDPLLDITRRDAATGEKWTLLTTGARKADGNPHSVSNQKSLAARQAVIDSIGQTLFELVASCRGLKVADVRRLEAGTFTAEQAVKLGLVDKILTLDELLKGTQATKVNTEETLATLRKAANGTDHGAKQAKKTLTATADSPGRAMSFKQAIAELQAVSLGHGSEAMKARRMLASVQPVTSSQSPYQAAHKLQMDLVMGVGSFQPTARFDGHRVVMGHSFRQ